MASASPSRTPQKNRNAISGRKLVGKSFISSPNWSSVTKATAGRRFLLEPDDGDVLYFTVLLGNTEHAAKACQRTVDYSIPNALGLPLLYKLSRRVNRNR
jgi:hypothetical protein